MGSVQIAVLTPGHRKALIRDLGIDIERSLKVHLNARRNAGRTLAKHSLGSFWHSSIGFPLRGERR
jgi:hypothetical protein